MRRGKRGDLLAEVTAAGVRALMVPRSPLGTTGRCGGNAGQNAGEQTLTGGELGADGKRRQHNRGAGTGGREVEA